MSGEIGILWPALAAGLLVVATHVPLGIRVLERHKRDPAKAVLRAAYDDPRPSEWLAARAGLRAVVLPYTVGGSPAAKDLFGLYEETIALLIGNAR